MKTEENLKSFIIERYGSVRAFAIKHDIAYTTVASVLKRGVSNSSVTTIVRMCDALNISSDQLTEGRIVVKSDILDVTDPVIDLNDLISSYKWTIKNNILSIDGRILTEQEKSTITTAIEISLEMIKTNTRSQL